jgi:acetoin utilization protein AcuB
MTWPKKLQEIPRVKMVMTPFPYSIEQSEPLEQAREMMANHRIHHVPVMEKGVPVGVISHRDMRRTLDQGSGRDGKPLTVADVPRDGAYVVDLSEPLDRVLQYMAKERLGAALVVKDGRLAGIFTLTDACQCFAEHLRQQFPPPGGTEAA